MHCGKIHHKCLTLFYNFITVGMILLCLVGNKIWQVVHSKLTSQGSALFVKKEQNGKCDLFFQIKIKYWHKPFMFSIQNSAWRQDFNDICLQRGLFKVSNPYSISLDIQREGKNPVISVASLVFPAICCPRQCSNRRRCRVLEVALTKLKLWFALNNGKDREAP